MKVKLTLCLILFFLKINVASAGFSEILAGVWEGNGKQNNGAEWSILFTSDGHSFSIEYPSLSCGGTWQLLSETQESATFLEYIQVGLDKCLNEGTVTLSQLEPDKLRFDYAKGNSISYGELLRVSQPLPPRLLSTLWDQYPIQTNLFFAGDLDKVVPGCTAVAVGQLINYYFQHGYSEGWLDRLLESPTVAYPRVGEDLNGNETIDEDEYRPVVVENPEYYNLNINLLDSYIDSFDDQDNIYTLEEEALADFLLLAGVALDAAFNAEKEEEEIRAETVVRRYKGQEPYEWVTDTPTKIGTLLVDRFRFRDSIRISRELATLSEEKQYIINSIDASLPVLASVYGHFLDANGNDDLQRPPVGHTVLIDNYRLDENGQFFVQINMGWGAVPETSKWWSGDESVIIRGRLKFDRFFIYMDTVPINFTEIR